MLEEARRAFPGRISADGKIVMSFHSFVLKTGRHTIVIDTCCNKSRPGRGQFDVGKADYLAGLAAAGVKPEEVTHVMCTHLHWDHVGWNTRLVERPVGADLPQRAIRHGQARIRPLGRGLRQGEGQPEPTRTRSPSRTACCR